MMAYQNGFVVSIIHNGHPVRESRGEDGLRTCTIPFDSEYKIRLKNISLSTAQVRVYIDGTPVLSQDSLILRCNQTIDLERFVTDLDKGRRFKFVPLSHEDVQDPSSRENGLIQVMFSPVRKVRSPTHNIMTPIGDFNYAFNKEVTCCANMSHLVSRTFTTSGATVEGTQSFQKFEKTQNEFELCGAPEHVYIRLVGQEQKQKKLWTVSGNDVFYKGERLGGVEQVMVSSTGTTMLFLDKDFVI